MTAITPSGLSELLARHGISPSRKLGQHFLTDPNLIAKMVKTAGVGPEDRVLEVGAGVGNLTVALARTGASVVAYEIDRRLAPVLAETVPSHHRVAIRMEDATKVDWNEALDGKGWVMVSNLPYGVGTPLLLEMIQRVPAVVRYTVMLQREVVQRLLARPGSREYGIPSVIVGLYARIRRSFDVPPQVFFPRPEVFSSVVELRRTDPHPDAELAVSLASAAFGKRRKMLRRSLDPQLVGVEQILPAAGISPRDRPEVLSPADFLRLAGAVRLRQQEQ
ncbi:MAG: 16S rRNA (adenine(1518)-N(6)/adenine(1519)-N(6))-dimethyltransferase RsmA [Actinomycetia bacterium]|nr:16S rRNA (adenine(1518)-N(6)/adenine(1519)-N(6))-dimethyltransferase RsmA [Actinomycetes bacterium]